MVATDPVEPIALDFAWCGASCSPACLASGLGSFWPRQLKVRAIKRAVVPRRRAIP